MKLTTVMAALAATLALVQSAHAREYYVHATFNHRQGVYQQGVHQQRVYHQRVYHHAIRRLDRSWAWGAENAGYWNRRKARSGWGNAQMAWRYRNAASEGMATRHARQSAFTYRSRYHAITHSRFAAAHEETRTSAYRGSPGARPSAWCGWEMRQLVGRDPGPEFNLARKWAQWGHAGRAGIGAVVVWPHHVGLIVGRQNGQWIIKSGNDGNRVRTRPLPIANAIAIRWD